MRKIISIYAIGIAIDRQSQIGGRTLTLDTEIYPIIKPIVNVKNEENLNKIKKWTLKNLLTHTTGYESQMMSEKYIENIDKLKLKNVLVLINWRKFQI